LHPVEAHIVIARKPSSKGYSPRSPRGLRRGPPWTCEPLSQTRGLNCLIL
jgi:hypothetical protein